MTEEMKTAKLFDVKAWLAKLDEYRDEPFMPEGRQQPPIPSPRKVFED
ncbi:MAG: hypothetical protein JO220_06540 [Hyphomicrobiales bacterium]|nr:hypothetical protein [Hyphomicrobiales bacterium]